jgi:hypothetical protein
MALNGDPRSRIRQRREHPAVQASGQIAQIVANRTFHRHPVRMDPGNFHPDQLIEGQFRQ